MLRENIFEFQRKHVRLFRKNRSVEQSEDNMSLKRESTLGSIRVLSRLDSLLNKDELTRSVTFYAVVHRRTFNLRQNDRSIFFSDSHYYRKYIINAI